MWEKTSEHVWTEANWGKGSFKEYKNLFSFGFHGNNEINKKH